MIPSKHVARQPAAEPLGCHAPCLLLRCRLVRWSVNRTGTARGTRMCRRGGAPLRSAPARHGPGPLRSRLPSLARPEVTGGDSAAPGRPGVPSTWPEPLFRTALAQRSAPPQGFQLGGLGVALLFYLGGHWVHWPTGCPLSRVQRIRWRCKESGASLARSANCLQLGWP